VTSITKANRTLRGFLVAAFLFGAVVASNGCVHIPGGAIPNPSGGPTGATPTPVGSCGALQTNTNAVIDMSQGIAASLDPIYGPILGYALDPGNGTFPTIAARVTLRPTDLVQFSNIDADIAYSAVGFGIKAFPPIPYSFPKGTQNPIGRQIGSNQWSTGLISPASALTGLLCYSQQFSLPSTGGTNTVTAYFGDFDRYNLTGGTFRDVIVVSSTAPQTRRRRRR
jgi:hypothetical protein